MKKEVKKCFTPPLVEVVKISSESVIVTSDAKEPFSYEGEIWTGKNG